MKRRTLTAPKRTVRRPPFKVPRVTDGDFDTDRAAAEDTARRLARKDRRPYAVLEVTHEHYTLYTVFPAVLLARPPGLRDLPLLEGIDDSHRTAANEEREEKGTGEGF